MLQQNLSSHGPPVLSKHRYACYPLFSLSPVFCFSVAACDVDALSVAASDPPHAVPPNTIAVVIANAKILFLIVFPSFFFIY